MVQETKKAFKSLASDPDAGGKWSLSRYPLLAVATVEILAWVVVLCAIIAPAMVPGREAALQWSEVEGPLRFGLELTPWVGAIFVGGKAAGKIKGGAK